MWEVLVERLVGKQYGRPGGLLGRVAGAKMAVQHLPENEWTLSLLQPGPDDVILEVGFGPGVSIAALAPVVTRGRVVGVDLSETMVRMAQRRNTALIREGRVDLRQGTVASPPFSDRVFDKAFAIHGIYFWKNPAGALRELYRVLKPGGILVLTMLPKEKWLTRDGRPDPGSEACVPYSGEEVAALLGQAGFDRMRIEADPGNRSRSNYSVVAERV